MKFQRFIALKTPISVVVFAAAALVVGTAANAQLTPPPIVLLGEVHDNESQHTLRVAVFKELLETGLRPALLMEQFDREDQRKIDHAIAASADLPAAIGATQIIATVVDAKGAGGSWNWAFYRPFLILALEHKLPIIAANVSRKDTRLIYSQGLSANGFNALVAQDIQATQTQVIHDSHCGMINLEQAGKMAASQVARDQWMAKQIEAHSRRGVVLLAGNGHVRKDVGVSRWLPEHIAQRTQSIGYLERDTAASDRDFANDLMQFDVVRYTATQQRDDPCAKFQKVPSK